MSHEIWQSRSVFDLPFNKALFIDNLEDAAAITAQHSTVLKKGELNYPYLHTLITLGLERRPIKGGKSIFCNSRPWQITLTKSFPPTVTSRFEGLRSP